VEKIRFQARGWTLEQRVENAAKISAQWPLLWARTVEAEHLARRARNKVDANRLFLERKRLRMMNDEDIAAYLAAIRGDDSDDDDQPEILLCQPDDVGDDQTEAGSSSRLTPTSCPAQRATTPSKRWSTSCLRSLPVSARTNE
jgi:hypothetical protein